MSHPAASLVITTKTTRNHVEHIYTKIGIFSGWARASTRCSAGCSATSSADPEIRIGSARCSIPPEELLLASGVGRVPVRGYRPGPATAAGHGPRAPGADMGTTGRPGEF